MLLLIPGPVTTHPAVRAALAQDLAPWDNDFRALYATVRERVLPIAGPVADTHAALPLQGCGHFALEACIRSFVPGGGRMLVPATGAYADRLIRLTREAGRDVVSLPVPWGCRTDPHALGAALADDPTISHVGLVYNETGSGVAHDAPALAAVAGRAGRRVILDAVSAFGALPVDLAAQPEIDGVVFTANKCLEAVAGMAFVLARVDRLRPGAAESWSFDLADIHAHALGNSPGTSRFTPPAQVIAAMAVALDLFEAEGGQPARLRRYQANFRAFYDGVRAIGLTPCFPLETQGPIVVNVHAPDDPAWDLQRFVDALKARGVLISNFHNTPEPSFRVGCIGAIEPRDMERAVAAMDAALGEIGVRERNPRGNNEKGAGSGHGQRS